MKISKSGIRDNKAVKLIVKYFVVIIGSMLFAAGFQFFMFCNSIVSGGVTGIAMILNRLFKIPVGLMSIIINIPLFIVAWKKFGRSLLIGSLVGMFLSSLFVDVFAAMDICLTTDPMLGAIIGGAIKGAGLGMIYYVGATTGGVDIAAKLFRRAYPQINFGTMILILDLVVVSAYALIFKIYESAMYSIIAMFVVSKVIDLVLYGLDNSSICYIISEKNEAIAKEIISGNIHRGVTLLSAQGAYSKQDKKVIMCVIKRTQILAIRRLIKSVDENAFVIMADAKNVFGNGFESINENK
ncbi:MAG: YitT family protein [Candidatus Limivicinus sp.]